MGGKTDNFKTAGVAQWVKHGLTTQKLGGLIPSQDTGLGCGPGAWLGTWDREQNGCLSHTSMFLSLPSPPSKNKYIKYLKKKQSIHSREKSK